MSLVVNAETGRTIYSKSYGQRKDPAIIFIQGGPSGNSTLFAGTTAETLASKGFYVIVYDRRGEGRSIDSTAKLSLWNYSTDTVFVTVSSTAMNVPRNVLQYQT
ncbi:MAG: alpha/beta hydrolase [Sphingobacterium sp.]|nr:alpha/beta hydrolase [Sphingobacterium sp.]